MKKTILLLLAVALVVCSAVVLMVTTSADAALASEVVVTPLEGEAITLNAENDSALDGAVAFDAATGTLTLTDASLKSVRSYGGSLIVNVVGTNAITLANGDNILAVEYDNRDTYEGGDLTVRGEAGSKLSLSAEKWVLMVRDGKLNIEGGVDLDVTATSNGPAIQLAVGKNKRPHVMTVAETASVTVKSGDAGIDIVSDSGNTAGLYLQDSAKVTVEAAYQCFRIRKNKPTNADNAQETVSVTGNAELRLTTVDGVGWADRLSTSSETTPKVSFVLSDNAKLLVDAWDGSSATMRILGKEVKAEITDNAVLDMKIAAGQGLYVNGKVSDMEISDHASVTINRPKDAAQTWGFLQVNNSRNVNITTDKEMKFTGYSAGWNGVLILGGNKDVQSDIVIKDTPITIDVSSAMHQVVEGINFANYANVSIEGGAKIDITAAYTGEAASRAFAFFLNENANVTLKDDAVVNAVVKSSTAASDGGAVGIKGTATVAGTLTVKGNAVLNATAEDCDLAAVRMGVTNRGGTLNVLENGTLIASSDKGVGLNFRQTEAGYASVLNVDTAGKVIFESKAGKAAIAQNTAADTTTITTTGMKVYAGTSRDTWQTVADQSYVSTAAVGEAFTVNAVLFQKIYDVTLPEVQGATVAAVEGYTTAVEHGKDFKFTVTLADNYNQSVITVKAGDTVLTAVDGVYTVANITADVTVTLEGVVVNPAVETFTVTFKADGKVVKEVEVVKGEDLTAFPEVPAKTGYTGKWDKTEIKNVTADLTVNAVYTANKADYSKLDALLKEVPSDEKLAEYTDETVKALKDVIASIDRNLTVEDQAKVDGYVKALETALAALNPKTVDVTAVVAVLAVCSLAAGAAVVLRKKVNG